MIPIESELKKKGPISQSLNQRYVFIFGQSLSAGEEVTQKSLKNQRDPPIKKNLVSEQMFLIIQLMRSGLDDKDDKMSRKWWRQIYCFTANIKK